MRTPIPLEKLFDMVNGCEVFYDTSRGVSKILNYRGRIISCEEYTAKDPPYIRLGTDRENYDPFTIPCLDDDGYVRDYKNDPSVWMIRVGTECSKCIAGCKSTKRCELYRE